MLSIEINAVIINILWKYVQTTKISLTNLYLVV